jgi:hypothetical protein
VNANPRAFQPIRIKEFAIVSIRLPGAGFRRIVPWIYTRERAQQELLEQNRLAQADTDKLIGDLRRQIDDLKRMAEQGSQQLQGEVMELELEARLRARFPGAGDGDRA